MMEEEKKELEPKKPETEDKYDNMGLVLGLCLGTAIGAATKNIGLWMCLGVCFGLLYDSSRRANDKKDGGDDQPQA